MPNTNLKSLYLHFPYQPSYLSQSSSSSSSFSLWLNRKHSKTCDRDDSFKIPKQKVEIYVRFSWFITALKEEIFKQI